MDYQSLSLSERILLAEQLWDSVRNKSDELELTESQRQILEARLTAYESDGDAGDSWDGVKNRILNNES